MTIEREILRERMMIATERAMQGDRDAQQEIVRLDDLLLEFEREEPKEDERGYITIYELGWSEERTKAAIERSNAMIAAAMLKGAER